MVRALVIGSVASAVSLMAGYPLLALLRRLGVGKAISEDGPESHMSKAGTPTMGGLLFVGTIVVFTLATNLVGHPSMLLPLAAMGAAALLGFADDLLTLQGRERIAGHSRLGFAVKVAVLIWISLTAALVLYYGLEERRMLVPHFGEYELNAVVYVAIAVAIIAATSSATAVTDGLDGLLGGLRWLRGL